MVEEILDGSADIAMDSAPVVDSVVDTAPAAEATPAEPAHVAEEIPTPVEPVPDSPAFDIQTWSGEVSDLPEDLLPLGTRIKDTYDVRLQSSEAEIDSLRDLYQAMLNGEEDPRINTMSVERDKTMQEMNDLRTQFDTYKQQVKAAIEVEAKEYVDKFKGENPQFFEKNELGNQFGSLLREGWEPEAAAKILSMDDTSKELAINARREGVPEGYAIKFAEADHKARRAQVPEPRPAAKITAGATGARNPDQATRGLGDAKTLDELRTMAARRALKALKGGRR